MTGICLCSTHISDNLKTIEIVVTTITDEESEVDTVPPISYSRNSRVMLTKTAAIFIGSSKVSFDLQLRSSL